MHACNKKKSTGANFDNGVAGVIGALGAHGASTAASGAVVVVVLICVFDFVLVCVNSCVMIDFVGAGVSRPPMGVWRGVAMGSLKFPLGPPCPTLLCPVDGPLLKRHYSRLRGSPPAGAGGLQK
jgi:hypothetical protein